jgi:branched-chain amino acid transport system substrate-binding protein
MRAVAASAPDMVYVASYPPDSVGIVRATNEIGFQPKLFGGSMVGLQSANIKAQLGPLLNGVVTFENWLPVPTMNFPGIADLIRRYQARAATEGVDALGYFMPPPAYAYLQVLGEAVAGVGSLDQARLAEYLHTHSFSTVWGEIRFGPDGEWPKPRMIQVQFRDVRNNDIDQFKDPRTEIILDPPEYRTGNLIYPYAEARGR